MTLLLLLNPKQYDLGDSYKKTHPEIFLEAEKTLEPLIDEIQAKESEENLSKSASTGLSNQIEEFKKVSGLFDGFTEKLKTLQSKIQSEARTKAIEAKNKATLEMIKKIEAQRLAEMKRRQEIAIILMRMEEEEVLAFLNLLD